MTDIFSIVSPDESLGFLNPVLESWADIIKSYPYDKYDDCPYYYSERMNTGLLGCAALMSNSFYPLEEHPIGRRIGPTKEKDNRSGRLDLWLVNCSSNKKNATDVIIESKMAWRPISIIKKSNDAASQLRRITGSYTRDCWKLSAVFCAPRFAESKFKEPEEKIMELIKSINESLKNSLDNKKYITAHCYPKAARSVKVGGNRGRYFYPGVSLVLVTV